MLTTSAATSSGVVRLGRVEKHINLYRGEISRSKCIRSPSTRHGLVATPPLLPSKMMMVFWKSGHVGKAQRIQVSGNAVLSVLLDSGRLDSASKLFAEMPPTSATSYTAMIDRFSRSIRVTEARYLFDSSPSGDRNVFSWAAMMSCSA